MTQERLEEFTKQLFDLIDNFNTEIHIGVLGHCIISATTDTLLASFNDPLLAMSIVHSAVSTGIEAIAMRKNDTENV
jgi:hypothetical protein